MGRVDLNVGFATIRDGRVCSRPGMVDDGAVAIAMASCCFLFPHAIGHRALKVMGPDVIPKLPWDIVLLFGGGFALAEGLQRTGLAQLIGEQFVALAALHICDDHPRVPRDYVLD